VVALKLTHLTLDRAVRIRTLVGGVVLFMHVFPLIDNPGLKSFAVPVKLEILCFLLKLNFLVTF